MTQPHNCPLRRGGRPAAVRLAAARAAVLCAAFWAAGMVLAGPANAAPGVSAAVCPEAPPGTQEFADDITSWVKWGVLALIGIGAVGSIGAVAFGRFMHNTQVSRFGTTGTLAAVCCAIAYGVILVIVDSIVGTGCT